MKNLRDSKYISYLISGVIHLLFILLFMALKINPDEREDEYVTVGFGTIGSHSSAGKIAQKQEPLKEPEEKKEKVIPKKEEEKKVELPKTKNEDVENIITSAEKKKKEEKPEPKIEPVKKDEESNKGRENTGTSEGSFGFEIDFGGKGKRKIYSFSLPSYPEGVSKEIDVKLRFSIMPDGTVGKVFPLIKADAQLESAAMNSIKKWRFEPLPRSQNQTEQVAVIVFPYRLQ